MKKQELMSLTLLALCTYNGMISIANASATTVTIQDANNIFCHKAGAKLTVHEAEACVKELIRSHDTDMHTFLQGHGGGKHLYDMANCAKLTYMKENTSQGLNVKKGSYFPENLQAFKEVFSGAEGTVACAQPNNNKITCTVAPQKNVCYLDPNPAMGGILAPGVLKKDDMVVEIPIIEDSPTAANIGKVLSIIPKKR
jgi:hypothetical protein